MHKISATYARPDQADQLLARNIAGYRKMLEQFPECAEADSRYRERRAEAEKMLGENLTLVGEASEGLDWLNRAVESDDGSFGDLLTRQMRRAESLTALRRFDEAHIALVDVDRRFSSVDKERGTYKVLIDKAYCRYYKHVEDKDSLAQRAENAFRSARRIGLKDQEFKIRLILEHI